MNRKVILALGLVTVSASTFARTERGSFLERPAHSTRELVAQLNDSRVLDRYARHFGMGKAGLSMMFGALHVSRIKKGGEFAVYLADENGQIGRKQERLKTGSLVFADQNERPILKQSCGNPLVAGSDFKPADGQAATGTQPSGFRVVGEGAPNQGLIPSDPTLTNLTPDTLVAETPDNTLLTHVDGAPSLASPSVPATATATAAPGGSGNSLGVLGWLAPIALLSQLGKGGGGGGGNNQPAPPVPEPITLVVMSVGAAGLLRRRPKA